MGSPSPSLISSTMHTFVLLSIVCLAFAAPMPEAEEAPAALPYVHDATGDVAEAYVHEEIAAEAYVHDATGDVAEEYVHVEPVVPAVAPVAPAVTYAAYPYAGCVNNVGSVVPCA